MGKGSPPAAPDPAATAAAQGAANKDTAIAQARLNRVDQVTPYGKLTYSQNPYETPTSFVGADGHTYWRAANEIYNDETTAQHAVTRNPTYTATTQLSPEQQQLLGLQTQGQLNLGNLGISQLGRINNAVAQPFDWQSIPGAPSLTGQPSYNPQSTSNAIQGNGDMVPQGNTPTDGSGFFDPGTVNGLGMQPQSAQPQSGSPNSLDLSRTAVEDALYQRLNPQIDRDRAQLEQRLANQGITAGSTAYNDAYMPFNQGINDARLAITAQGGQEQSRLFGLQEAARQQAIQEQSYARAQPLNEFNSFMSGSQVQMPDFQNVPQTQVAPNDVLGAYGLSQQAHQANYAQQMAARNSTTGGLFGLGSAALIGGAMLASASDERLKTNIEHLDTRDDGIGIYKYNYKWDESQPYIGVMAQEVEKVRPDAVHNIGGIKAVEYAKLLR